MRRFYFSFFCSSTNFQNKFSIFSCELFFLFTTLIFLFDGLLKASEISREYLLLYIFQNPVLKILHSTDMIPVLGKTRSRALENQQTKIGLKNDLFLYFQHNMNNNNDTMKKIFILGSYFFILRSYFFILVHSLNHLLPNTGITMQENKTSVTLLFPIFYIHIVLLFVFEGAFSWPVDRGSSVEFTSSFSCYVFGFSSLSKIFQSCLISIGKLFFGVFVSI